MSDFNTLVQLSIRLASDHGVTVQELLRSQEFRYNSRSSIYQDFRNLEKNFGLFPEKTDELRGKSGREAVFRIDKSDWNRFKTRFLTRTFDDKDRRRLSFLIESAGNSTPLVDVSGDDIIPKLQTIFGEMTVNPSGCGGYFSLDNTDNLDKLLEFQGRKDTVFITYDGRKREVFVLKCFVFSGGTYCYVMNKEGLVYTMSVPRIEKIEVPLIRRRIPYPEPSIDIEEALADPFGIILEEEAFDAVVRLSEIQAPYELEKRWPDTVRIEKDGDSWLFKVHTYGYYWLKKWVLSMGMEAELLEPDWLRSEIGEELKEMMKAYT